MKIKELLLDFIISTQIFEMAYHRKDALRHVSDLNEQIARHLIKIAMYQEVELAKNISHWIGEVNAWLADVQNIRVTASKNRLSYDDLHKILFDQPLGTIDDIQTRMNRIYKEYPQAIIGQPDARVIHKQLEAILTSVCTDISKGMFDGIAKYLKTVYNI